MDFAVSSYVIIFFLVSKASASCKIEDVNEDCNYTIACESYVESTELPACSAHKPTLLIKNSSVETFSPSLYRSINYNYLITYFEAVNNNWTTIAPLAFNFSHCSNIDLSNNAIKTISNDAFLISFSLQYLNLSRNAIDELYPRSFAVTMNSWLNRITVLDLSFNLLTDISNGSLHCLPELKRLYLNGNKLLFLKDDTFMNLNNLFLLSLRDNQLTTLNVSLVYLRSLQYLDLSFNKLKQLRGYELVHSKSLKTIDLSHNAIETVDSNVFSHAAKLKIVDFSNNVIKSPINMFFNNSNLKRVNFCNNSITAIDHAFAYRANNLEAIDFSLNHISELPSAMFVSTEKLKLLNFSSNSLSELRSGSLNSQSMKVLDLSRNILTKLDVSVFKQCTNLEELILDFNFLGKIDFGNLTLALPKLTVLSLGSNWIPCNDLLNYSTKGKEMGVNVTSIDKIFNEVNVQGIPCGHQLFLDVKKSFFIPDIWVWFLLVGLCVVIIFIAMVCCCMRKSTGQKNKRPELRRKNNDIELSEIEELDRFM